MTTAPALSLTPLVRQRLREIAPLPGLKLATDYDGQAHRIVWTANGHTGGTVIKTQYRRSITPLLEACRAELARLREGR